MNLQNTQTLTNLMRAFAGESMAWSRYVRAAEIAEQEKLPVIARVFRFTAGQEKEHGEIFAQFL
ncbi:MAG: rubrerythrin family protein, partial [Oscillospiraceae bacterium]|nr:rubrerythrin family protein [Oscillospiraceae bacterium]